MTEDKEYSVRIVCDDLSTPIDWPLFSFTVPGEYLDKVDEIENFLNYLVARFGDKVRRFKIGEMLLGWYEYLGYIVDAL
jgi:hypothetical protein